jgi:hypothetical protein
MDICTACSARKNQRHGREPQCLAEEHCPAEQWTDTVVQRSGDSSFSAIAAIACLPDVRPADRCASAGTEAGRCRRSQSGCGIGHVQRHFSSKWCRFGSSSYFGAELCFHCVYGFPVGLLDDREVRALAVLSAGGLGSLSSGRVGPVDGDSVTSASPSFMINFRNDSRTSDLSP